MNTTSRLGISTYSEQGSSNPCTGTLLPWLNKIICMTDMIKYFSPKKLLAAIHNLLPGGVSNF